MALDGSLFAEQAVVPAGRLAIGLGVPLHLWTAARTPAEAEDRRPRIRSLAEVCGASWEVVVADRPVEAMISKGTAPGHPLICLATHGRDHTAALVHSVSAAEPVPESVGRPGYYPRLHGPHCDADAYLEAMAAAWRGDVAVTARVIYDPVDVDGALIDAFVADPPDLVVMGTRAPYGLRRLILGSTAAAVAHGSPVPVLVLPL